jgi:3-deoxy-D-manno-octulosonic-acid transferase
MNAMWFAVYNALAIPLLRAVLWVARAFNRKVRRGLDGRRRLFEELESRLGAFAGRRPRFWIHSSSMGEFEQAKPVLEALRARFPGCFTAVSFFSPSGFDHVRSFPAADVVSYLPFDSASNADRFIRLLRPDVGVVVRHDIWPNHVAALNRCGVPAVLINYSLRPRRLLKAAPVRSLFGSVLNRFDLLLAVSRETVETARACGFGDGRIEAAGDTRYDQVMRRTREAVALTAPLEALRGGRPCAVFGSTWPSDEAVVFAALDRLRAGGLDPWSVLVPHEPTPGHLAGIESACAAQGLRCRRLSAVEARAVGGAFDVLLVDRVGILAGLYGLCDAAFVGGGFGPGVHSVLEPAAFGKPVYFGPRCGNSYEAGQLEARGGGGRVEDPGALAAALDAVFRDPEAARERGERSLALVRENLGATERIVDRLQTLLPSRD